MTRKNDRQNAPDLKALIVQNHDLMQPLMQWLLQEVLEQEMTDSFGAALGERSEDGVILSRAVLMAIGIDWEGRS